MLVRLQLDEEDAATARKWPLAVALRNERTAPGDLVVLTAHRTCVRTVGTMGGQDVDPPLSAERGCGTDCHNPRHRPRSRGTLAE